VATKIDADVREEDIDICHRLNKKMGKPRPIIIKFNNYDAKYELYSKRLRLRKIDFMDSLGTERVFVNENLTSRRSLLYSKVPKNLKDNDNWTTWTNEGKVFLKTSHTGRSLRIKTEEDLSKVKS